MWNTCKYPECEHWTRRPDGDYCGTHERTISKEKETEIKSLTKRSKLLAQAKERQTKVKDLKDSNLWIPFSKYIRLRDSDENGICTCFTCGHRGEWNNGWMQAGHFIGRRHWATRYNEQNVNAQCGKCNQYNAGMQYEYSLKLDQVYGAGTAQMLNELSKQTIKLSQQDIDEKAAYYRELVKEKLANLRVSRLATTEPHKI